tara:strand:- start:933 stop:1238 length:306 start_codon:yes stop_codon:yes gene_type:complete
MVQSSFESIKLECPPTFTIRTVKRDELALSVSLLHRLPKDRHHSRPNNEVDENRIPELIVGIPVINVSGVRHAPSSPNANNGAIRAVDAYHSAAGNSKTDP